MGVDAGAHIVLPPESKICMQTANNGFDPRESAYVIFIPKAEAILKLIFDIRVATITLFDPLLSIQK